MVRSTVEPTTRQGSLTRSILAGLLDRMEATGQTKADLARALGVQRGALDAVWAGKSDLTVTRLQAWCQALDFKLVWEIDAPKGKPGRKPKKAARTGVTLRGLLGGVE